MSHCSFAARARCDLLEIKETLEKHSPLAVAHLMKKFEKAFRLIGSQPGIGSIASDVVEGYRMFMVRKYVIFYEEVPSGARVVRIIHGARDLSRIFD